MPRKVEKKYGPKGQYYRKRIKRPDGTYEDVYGKTLAERDEKVTLRLNALAAEENIQSDQLYFFEYAAGWFAREAPHKSEKRQKDLKFQVNKVICPVIGGKLLAQITSDDLKDVMTTRAHLGKSAQQKTVQVLKQIFDAAEDAEKIARSPAKKLKAHGDKATKRRALTKQQEKDLLSTVAGLPVETYVMLALYTGMRKSEICGLKWDSVDLTEKAPSIRVQRACRWPENKQPKVEEILKSTAAWRTIPIPQPLFVFLKDLRGKQLAALTKKTEDEKKAELQLRGRFVYGAPEGSAITFSGFRRRWDAIRNRSTASGRPLGEKVRNKKYSITLDFCPAPHDLRHTYITRLILGKVDLKRVQYLAGHSDPKVTLQIYTELMGNQPEDLIDDVNAIFAPGK